MLFLSPLAIYMSQNWTQALSADAAAAAAAKSLQSCPTLCDPRWQPTRLPHPWDSPGKNTGVGCHLLLQCMKMKGESEVAQSCLTPLTAWEGKDEMKSFCVFSTLDYIQKLSIKIDFLYSDVA